MLHSLGMQQQSHDHYQLALCRKLHAHAIGHLLVFVCTCTNMSSASLGSAGSCNHMSIAPLEFADYFLFETGFLSVAMAVLKHAL